MELKKYKLGDLCTFINGRAYLQPELQNSGKYKIVRVGNLSGGNNFWYYSDMELEPTKYCAKGDLLYAWACNFGPYIWKGDKTIYHYHIWKVINSDQIDKMYLYYLLKFMTNSFMGCVHGSTMLHITKENMESMEVRIHASIEEQRRIATILNKLDCKIGLNRQINDNLEAMAKQLYDYWFVQFDFPNEEGKPYRSSGGAMVRNEKLKREIPQGWSISNVKSLIEPIERGISYSSDDLLDPFATPMINLACFSKAGDYRLGEMKFFSGKVSNDKLISPMDMLIACTDMTQGADIIGRPILASDESDQYTFSTDLALITPKGKFKMYLYYTLRTPFYHKYIRPFASGTTVKHLNLIGVENYGLPVPPIEIQSKFEDLITPIKEKQSKNLNEINALTKQRDELLPLLMNGQATVNYHLSDD